MPVRFQDSRQSDYGFFKSLNDISTFETLPSSIDAGFAGNRQIRIIRIPLQDSALLRSTLIRQDGTVI